MAYVVVLLIFVAFSLAIHESVTNSRREYDRKTKALSAPEAPGAKSLQAGSPQQGMRELDRMRSQGFPESEVLCEKELLLTVAELRAEAATRGGLSAEISKTIDSWLSVYDRRAQARARRLPLRKLADRNDPRVVRVDNGTVETLVEYPTMTFLHTVREPPNHIFTYGHTLRRATDGVWQQKHVDGYLGDRSLKWTDCEEDLQSVLETNYQRYIRS